MKNLINKIGGKMKIKIFLTILIASLFLIAPFASAADNKMAKDVKENIKDNPNGRIKVLVQLSQDNELIARELKAIDKKYKEDDKNGKYLEDLKIKKNKEINLKLHDINKK